MKMNPGAEPFFLCKNHSRVILFLHGFTASPSELYPTAQRIHEESDCDIQAILLPGHGTKPADLNETVWQDWFGAVEEEAGKLLNNYREVYTAGLSMGGLLAYHAGVNLPGVRGVVAINAPIFTQYPVLSALAPVMKKIVPYFTKGHRREKRLELQGRYEYSCYPVKAYTSLTDLRRRIIAEMEDLKVPLLVIQSLQDQAVNPESAAFIIKNSVNCISKLITLSHSGHIATMEGEQDIISHAIIEFTDKNRD